VAPSPSTAAAEGGGPTPEAFRTPVLELLRRAKECAETKPPTAFVVAHSRLTNTGVTGVAKALAKEWPETMVRAIELPPAAPVDTVAQTLFNELLATDQTVEVTYTARRRQILSVQRAVADARAIPEGAVVAVSGGARGLGAKLAIELARRHHARLLHLGRSGDAGSTIESIRAAGGDAMYVACDVRDAAQVAAAFAQCRASFGPVTHIVHAAGIIADEPVTAKTVEHASAVFDTKVAGALALWEAARPDPLATFLVYGSWAGRFGNAHQTDYAAANHILGRLAAVFGSERTGVRFVTVDLPPWEDSGMVSSLPEAVQRAMKTRVRFLNDEIGLDRIITELGASGPSGEVILGANLEDVPSIDRTVLEVSTQHTPWLVDHQLEGRIVLPFAMLVDQAASTARRLGIGPAFSLTQTEISEMLTAPPDSPTYLIVEGALHSGVAEVGIEPVGRATRQPSLRLRATTITEPLPLLSAPSRGQSAPVSLAEFYERRIFHGPSLRALRAMTEVGSAHAIGRVRAADDATMRGSVDILALDGLLQVCAYWASSQIGRIGLPLGAEEIRVLALPQPGAELNAIGILKHASGEVLSSDLDLTDGDGRALLQIRGLRCRLIEFEMQAGAESQEEEDLAARLPIKPGAAVDPSSYRIEAFPEVQALQQRMEMARIAGIKNPYFTLHERVTNDTSLIEGREFVNFSSYNYIGLSGDPDVNHAAAEAIERYGTSVSASRLASGEKPLHREFEHEIADFLGCEDAIVMVGGHATNVSVIGHMFGPQDLIVHDSLAHDSILAGIKLSGARRRPFPHNDYEALDQMLRQIRGGVRRVLIAVEGVYSMDGDIAPLDKMIEVKKRHNALMLVDEAHSLGVLGKTGAGVGEHFNVNRSDVELWMGTLSKSLASCGGYIAGSSALAQYLKYTNPGFVYSVGISPANAAAALAALRKMRAHPELITMLHERSRFFLELCRERGINTGMSDGSAVIPCIVGSSADCLRLSQALAARQINVQPILYPAVEEALTRLRFFVTARHSEAQLRMTADALAEEWHRIRPRAAFVNAPQRTMARGN
jgi:8-amino-7-oxononanoate synthase